VFFARASACCQHEINLWPVCDQRKRFPTTCGWNRWVSESIEHSEGGPPDCPIVIDDQDAHRHFGPRTRNSVDRFLFAIAEGDFGSRQEDLHRGAFADACLYSHAARLLRETMTCASPRRTPGSFVVKKGSKTCGSTSSGMPMPVSLTARAQVVAQ
jgi:hypothetical protein